MLATCKKYIEGERIVEDYWLTIARIAKVALHKLPGKSSFNVSFICPVCPVCPVYLVCTVCLVCPDDHDNHDDHDDHPDHDDFGHQGLVTMVSILTIMTTFFMMSSISPNYLLEKSQ